MIRSKTRLLTKPAVVRWYSVENVDAVLPRKTLRKYLFEFKVPLSYKIAVQIYHECRTNIQWQVPSKVSSQQLMTLKRILETHRRRAGVISKDAITIENNLVEKAAEMGNNWAIALLCGTAIADKNGSPQDREYGNNLLRQLMDRKFPLAFKIAGDLAYQMGHPEKAIRFYELAVDNGLDDNALLVECLRNIGLISLMTDKNVIKAREYFEIATQTAQDLKQVSDCHFYLGQILDQNKIKARYHLQRAASVGLRESFAPLGFLLMNYFNEVQLAHEWFDLGSSVDDFNCLVGLFDSCVRLGDSKGAFAALGRIRSNELGTKVLEGRKDSVERVLDEIKGDDDMQDERVESKDRWTV